MESSTLPDETVITATGDIVAVASHVDNDHGTVEIVENGRKVKRCSIYPSITCEDHIRTSEVGKQYIKGRFAAPVSIWCDAKGKELFRKYGYRQPETFQGDLKEAVGKVAGKRVPKAEYDLQAIPLEDAEAAQKDGRWKAAVEGFTSASKGSIEPLKKMAETGLAQVKRVGQSVLDKGRKAAASGRTEQAKEAFQYVVDNFGTLDCAREAAEALKALPADKKG